MHSSTSSSEFVRPIPALNWTAMVAVTLVIFLGSMAAWETYCRVAEWLRPSLRNSDGLWAMTRDRIDREDGGVAIIGSSRVLFDINLATWRELTGGLPIQLALEGTNPAPFLTHLAQESPFKGLLVVGVTEFLFFSPVADPDDRYKTLLAYKTRTPADRASQWLSMNLFEPFAAFYDPDFALFTIVRRQPWWPARADIPLQLPAVRKLASMDPNRQYLMWERVERDPAFQKIARDTWLAYLNAPPPPLTPEQMMEHVEKVMTQARADVAAIRARGGEVIFLRSPSAGPFLDVEHMAFPRQQFFDRLVKTADAAGVHFEDFPDMQVFELPEWSHIAAEQTGPYTRALVPHLRAALEARGTPRRELGR